jgi:hypothetical protein
MANKLFVKEYVVLGNDKKSVAQVPMEPALVEQTPVDFTSGSTQSAAFNDATTLVLLESDTDCHITFGTNPTSTTDKEPLKAGVTKYRSVKPGSALKVAAISA